ncbi:DEAD/DEAH box helicase [candidate division CSSED10-310 bacterium]|uniref:DEAD/DEAH box helicase n=1 Tax=candidate division CSSED10-310 bacterium TaxID=2855610 RepID=A0ABV6YRJ9_UNCC1
MATRKKSVKKAPPRTLKDFVHYLKVTEPFRQTLVHHHRLEESAAAYGVPEGGLPDWLEQAIRKIGITKLYIHQSRAIDLIRARKNVVLVTPTASGKSLAFNIPVLETLVQEPEARALYLFPLKALEQDQLARLNELMSGIPSHYNISADIYDGDTPKARRQKIRKKLPRILISNPDMLHHGIMPYHTQWEELFRTLRFIVIDELHTYRGVFGSHILQIFRRIRRLADFYGSHFQCIAASATIENPLELAEALMGEKFDVIEQGGAPQKTKHFLFFNPVQSPYTEAARLMAICLEAGLKTIAFTRSRKITELLYTWCLEGNPALRSRISAYRAGFLPGERREIEEKLFSGELEGVISTSALEMGIDIGGLDACLLVGYPGTITATWQRGGRVGRQDRESLIVLISGPDALDQYFMLNPNDFFERPCERAIVDGDNEEILRNHLVCAAAEVPLRKGEIYFDTDRYAPQLEKLVADGKLESSASGKQWFASKALPHRDMDIRSMGIPFTIMSPDKKVIGMVSGRQRYAECHPGAVYLHRGNQYLIEAVDESQRFIDAKKVTTDYYTMPLSEKETDILATYRQKQFANFRINQGQLRVTEIITGFQRKRMLGQELIDKVPLSFPPLIFETVGIWIEIEEEIRHFLQTCGRHYMGSLHGIEHAVLSLFPLFALCDRNDVGGVCKPHHGQIQKGVIFLYDGHAGGVGLTTRAYDVINELLSRTLILIESCPCDEGCPSCIQSPKCGSGNKPLDKKGAIVTLKLLLAHDIEAELLPASAPAQNIPLITIREQVPIPLPAPPEHFAETQPDKIPGRTWLEEEKHVLVFDLETQKSAHEVGGWGNSHLMRISVGIIYDSALDRFLEFFEETVEDLIEHLKSAELVVGFNSIRFDYSVLRGYSGFNFKSLPSFDLCLEVQKALGRRMSLNQLAQATLQSPKTADGLQALEWFKQGQLDLITEYCRHDVTITRDIFRFGLIHQYLLGFEKKSSQIIRIPLTWAEQLRPESEN